MARGSQLGLSRIPLVDPADGLPLRDVGSWTDRKLYFLDRYMDIFAQGMRYKFDRRVYVDLFAGPGRCINRESLEIMDGSPLISLRHPFTDHIFVELDPDAVAALRSRTSRASGGRRINVIEGDCNTVIDDVIALIPRYALVFAFVDPTNWQVRFETIRRLAETRRVDVLVSFFGGMMKRVMHLDEQPRLDAFFGSTAYRAPGERPTLSTLMEAYRGQLLSIGYVDHAARREVTVTNSKNATMYLLAYFSKHARGYDFWDKITAEDETGQLAMPWT